MLTRGEWQEACSVVVTRWKCRQQLGSVATDLVLSVICFRELHGRLGAAEVGFLSNEAAVPGFK
jgi:hypothetical protein